MLRRVSVPVQPLSQRDIEDRAEALLRILYPENLIIPQYLNVLEMLEKLSVAPICIDYQISDLNPGEEGYTDPFKKLIVLDSNVYRGAANGEGRPRTTCCHEVGHIQHISQLKAVLHEGLPQLSRKINKYVPAYCDPEWQASAFAGAMLMPRSTTPVIYQQGGITTVASFFGVTISAATVRLSVLKRLRYV